MNKAQQSGAVFNQHSAPRQLDQVVAETERRQPESPELMRMRLENQTIIAECRTRPRNFTAIKKQLQQLLDEFPEFAVPSTADDDHVGALYSKPAGRDPDTGKMKWVTGLSIRAAETMAELYGYNRVAADVEIINADTVKIKSTFTDYQNGRIWEDAAIVSKWYTTKKGQRVKHKEDRFWDIVVKAAKSKVIREAINRCVNQALKAWFTAECMRIAGTMLSDDQVKKIEASFKEFGANAEQLATLLGKDKALGWTEKDRIRLKGMYALVRDGEETIESLLKLANGDEPDEPASGADNKSDKLGKPFDEYEAELAICSDVATLDGMLKAMLTEAPKEMHAPLRKAAKQYRNGLTKKGGGVFKSSEEDKQNGTAETQKQLVTS